MSDPYRTATLRCPACQDTLLRSFLHRLICDRCHGLQIQPDDLMGQIGTGDLVDLVDREATTRVCPRCPQPLTACALRVGDVDLGHGFARCPRHGLWLDGGQLEHVLETIARHGHMGVGGRGKWYGGARGGLRARRQKRPRRVRVDAAPSRFEDQALTCPACADALHHRDDRWDCDGCRGVFVENAALELLMIEMTGQPWTLPAAAGAAGDRTCPICAEALIVERFEDAVTIDRCTAHGLWFDAGELADALARAGGGGRHGGWLGRLRE